MGEYADERVAYYSDPAGPERAFRRYVRERAMYELLDLQSMVEAIFKWRNCDGR